jgi:hypothetical protein
VSNCQVLPDAVDPHRKRLARLKMQREFGDDKLIELV